MSQVSGIIKLSNDEPFVGKINFRPISTPIAAAPNLITTADIEVLTEDDGQFETELLAGDYKVFVGRSRNFLISVPDDEDSYNFVDLITTSLTYTAAAAPGDATVPLATSTLAGKVKLDINQGDPIVLTKTTFEYSGGGGILVASTLSAMRQLVSRPSNKICFLLGSDEAFDERVHIFAWDPTLTDADDFPAVVRPNDFDSAGGWRQGL